MRDMYTTAWMAGSKVPNPRSMRVPGFRHRVCCFPTLTCVLWLQVGNFLWTRGVRFETFMDAALLCDMEPFGTDGHTHHHWLGAFNCPSPEELFLKLGLLCSKALGCLGKTREMILGALRTRTTKGVTRKIPATGLWWCCCGQRLWSGG